MPYTSILQLGSLGQSKIYKSLQILLLASDDKYPKHVDCEVREVR